jgi:hypothetical protein
VWRKKCDFTTFGRPLHFWTSGPRRLPKTPSSSLPSPNGREKCIWPRFRETRMWKIGLKNFLNFIIKWRTSFYVSLAFALFVTWVRKISYSMYKKRFPLLYLCVSTLIPRLCESVCAYVCMFVCCGKETRYYCGCVCVVEISFWLFMWKRDRYENMPRRQILLLYIYAAATAAAVY